MKTASIADVKARLSAYLKESLEGPVIVTRNGKAVAVLLAVTDEDELERLVLAHSPRVPGDSRQVPAPDRSDQADSPCGFLA
jgi:prevent-host-death family protein